MKHRLSLLLVFLGINTAISQDIFKQHGFTKEPLTLSQGKYKEFFENQTFVQIGSVILNTSTNEVVAFVEEDTAAFVYHADLSSRWLCPDPLASKYPQVSPYTYCLNNPIIFIDPDGKDVEIVIGKPYTKNGKEHPYGHMAIRVYGDGYDYVFDFGRYGKTWGIGKGEGILNVYTEGGKYLSSEQKFRESVGFNLKTTSEEDKTVIDYYLNLAKEGGKSETTGGEVPGGGGTSYKLDEDYSVFSNNCVTKSGEGLEQIDKNKVGDEYDPRDVLKNFESNYKELGFTKKTIYLEGGGVQVVYERKPLPEPQKKEYENHY